MKPILSKVISSVKKYQYEVFTLLSMTLVALIAFNLGRIDTLKKTPITLEQANIFQAANTKNSPIESFSNLPVRTDLRVIASKASKSMKYHFLWCPGAQKIKEENKIYFENEAAAIAAGYTLAGNCQK